ncbi:hypothetical protein P3X46_023066 [Hevea brasiliensis]|uniref:Uncharacterized protein n=1 Tax=Hevea brasiliensis TaxID=3981 RepID=A0ABQ9LCI0_HEVBR|nr:uncharacterized protein LOC110646322 [Hevea brasiliensis]KAJ9163394.1 hypothetical protein P3X46_023066 [Hevea brasiliensis]
MVRLLLVEPGGDHLGGGSISIILAIGLFLSVSALVALLCAKHSTRRVRRRQMHDNSNNSPLASPTRISDKTIDRLFKNNKKDSDDQGSKAEIIRVQEVEGGFGEGGVWQKSILMGERCRPPEFSGVMYYDSHGNQVSEMPRSPRANHLPSFSFPIVKDTNY